MNGVEPRRSRRAWLLVLLAGAVALAAAARRWRAQPALAPAALQAASAALAAVPCYYPARAGFDLVEVSRQIPADATSQERLLDLIIALHRPPERADALPLFPEGTSPRGAFLGPDGTAYVDEPAAALDRSLGVREELLLVRALCRTVLKNVPGARSVVILVDGAARHRLALHLPAHGRYVLPARPAAPK